MISYRLQRIGEERRSLILDIIKDPSTSEINESINQEIFSSLLYFQGSVHDTVSHLAKLNS